LRALQRVKHTLSSARLCPLSHGTPKEHPFVCSSDVMCAAPGEGAVNCASPYLFSMLVVMMKVLVPSTAGATDCARMM
jgi:hypothetical protein